MKRLGSLLLSFLMLVCMLPISAAATEPAANDAEKLIFDMDLSAYATDGTITNSVAGNDTTISFSTAKPVAGTVDKTNTPYVTFRAQSDTTNPKNSFSIADAGFASQDALTVETWIKPDMWGSGDNAIEYLFSLYSNSKNVMDVAKWGKTNTLYYDAAGDGVSPRMTLGSTVNPYDETWAHMVFTRTWTPDAEGTTGTWTGKFYVNGKQLLTSKKEGATRNAEGTTGTFFISARGLNSGSFYGSMGEFKVYQSELSEESIARKYEATRPQYYYEVGERELGEDKLFFDMSIADDGTVTNAAFDDGGTEISTQNVTMGETVTGQNYFSFRESGAVDSASSVKVTDSYFVNQDELTLEMWVRPQDWQSTKSTTIANDDERLFSLRGTRSYMDYYFFKAAIHRYQPFVDSTTKSISLSGMAAYDEKWTHLVFTRKWTPDSEGAATGTWTANMYVNGVQKVTDWTYTDTRVEEDATTAFIIGNASHGGIDTFSGDIAMVKAYQSILDADTIGANYMSSYTTYYPEMPADDAEKLIFDMDISRYAAGNTITNASPYADSSISVTSNAPVLGELANGTEYLTFATYDGETVANKDRRIEVKEDALLNQNEMTFETWIRGSYMSSANTSWGALFGSAYTDMYIQNGNLMYWQPKGDDSTVRLNSPGMANYNQRWIHLVATRTWTPNESDEGGTWTGALYVNGVKFTEKSVAKTSRTNETSNVFSIGKRTSNGSSFCGDISTFKIYNTVLDADAIAEKYTATRGNYAELGEDKLIFDMDLSAYTEENPVVTSVSGNANITVQGTLAVGTTAEGKKYLTFDSKNEDGTYANNASGLKVVDDTLMNQKAMTVETWVRGTDFGGAGVMYDDCYIFQGPRMEGRAYEWTDGTSTLWWDPLGDNASYRLQQSNIQKYNNEWKHLAFTKAYDETAGEWTYALYIDGAKISSATKAAEFGNETSNVLMIGNNQGLAHGFEGDIATFKVYNTVLTEAQIKASYKADKEGMQGLIALGEFNTESETITATVDADLLAQNPFVVIALYDENDDLVQVATGTTLTISGEVTLKEGYRARCFVWGSKTDLKPLTKEAIAYCL